ncbi:uncharacterized protein LOC116296157 isoform X2 [Actinia tenebrosa]|uniref:Uncharacterized protein LOC116296157 isoform X2 n=1 Tax=Actinia tenebrosa TaxID=6105 RepID=A0A6P8HXC1_ACTTE|nr:uncharacterized protein LOC116296157 isoform X2 [Actinia tenebrosa]
MSKRLLSVVVFSLLFFYCNGCGGGGSSSPDPRHGNWGAWYPQVDFNGCNCRGIVTQHRNCDNPSPAHGGRACDGANYRDHDCNECSCNKGGCQHQCRNIYGSYECSCDNEYRKDGHNCVEITCRTSDWPAPENGAKTDSSCNNGYVVSVGTTCQSNCKPGYTLEGSSRATCRSDGNWIPSNPPICRVVTCSSISVPVHGSVTPAECTANPTEGTVCTLACKNGYSLVQYSGSEYQTRCSAGRWTNPTNFYCRDLMKPVFSACPEGIQVYADKMQTKATVSWEPVNAKDNDGHVPQMQVYPSYVPPSATSYEFPEGSFYMTYTARDSSGNTATCSFRITVQVRRCPAVSPPTNGRTIPPICSNLYGSKCSIECNEGYNLTGSASRECVRENGSNAVKWTGADVTCQKITCPKLIEPKHTTMAGVGCISSNPSYKTYCTYSCKTGYQAKSGSKIRTCKSDGMWSGGELVCQMVTCPALASLTEGLNISNQSCISQTSSYQDECRYTCGKGYILLGTVSKTCSSTGQWSPSGNPYCRDISMPTFNSCPANVRVFADRKSWSTQVNWTIPTASDNAPGSPTISHHGQRPGELFSAGHHTIKYVATDKSGNSASCIFQVSVEVVTCPALQTPLRGYMQCSNKNIFGSECQFVCNLGYTLRGSQQRTCEKNALSLGYWTGNSTYCEAITCPNLDHPVNGFKSGCSRNTFGENCLFYCNIGSRVVNGSASRTCLQNGTWSGTSLICEGITCPALAVPAKGRIIPNECYNTVGYRVSCQFVCENGYQLMGSNIRTCLANGQWNDQSNVSCRDIETPRFTTSCPYNIDVFAEENKDTAQVIIPPMNATDNSGELPTIKVEGTKTNYTAGRHLITITASDASGNKATCRFYVEVTILRCYSHPSYITNGRVVGVCKNTYGSTCHFQCNDGYNITGSSSRTCKAIPGQIQGYWTGTMPFCSVNRCPPLQRPANGYVYPPMCVASNGPVIDTTCLFGCYNGYVQSAGTPVITCGKSSRWDRDVATIIKCLDKTPPVFTKSCPSNIRISLGHNGTATANWTIPVAEDNSNIPPTVTVTPPDAVPPYSLNKSIVIEYKATDNAGNIGKCSFKIVVEDNIGPRVDYCPPNQTIRAKDMSEKVHWTLPIFVDNSNAKIVPQCNRQSGTVFYWGVWTIHCRGYDDNPDNQPAVCTFNITVEPTPCPSLTPPKNGAKACDTWAFGRFCTPQCNSKHDFAVSISIGMIWVCGSSGVWNPPNGLPDCSETYVPRTARKAASLLYYFEGDCNDPAVQEQVKKNFIQILKQSLFKQMCTDDQMKERCNFTNVEVVCGVTSRGRRSIWEESVAITSRRTRRSVPSKQFKVSFEFSLSLDSGGASNKTFSEIQSSSANASSKMAAIEKEMKRSLENGSLALNISGQVVSAVNDSLATSPTSFVCNTGQIFLNQKCVACPVGTYHNTTLDRCIDCNKGWYQETEGQESCSACPVGMSTVGSKAKNKTDCKAYCKRGHYSPTGLEPCVACDKGSYQSMDGQLKCKTCPDNQTTHSEGATSLNNCSASCMPGSYSPNGLEPCKKCDKRSYQSNSESTSCVSCSGTKTTLKEGSNSSSACQEINECDSNPCQHGSTCIDLIEDFACQCQEGYTGKQCEQDIDDCAAVPCENNATCHDHLKTFTCTCAAGFTGSVCQTEIDECISSPCLNNATCHDLIGRYKCICQPGYEGDRCEREINECQPNPCLNGGTCTDKLNAFSCQCLAGFTGSKCEENIDDCPQNRCANGATCNDQVNNYTCTCLPGYTGFYCDQEINECRSNPCKHNGTCYNTIGSFTCTCPVGYNGSICETEIDECQSSPCLNGATCRDAVGSFSCICSQGYHGDNCEKDIDECAFQPCTNNANCTNTAGSFTCHCQNGFTGKTCDKDIDECLSKPCLNNGSCINERNAFSCQCRDGFTGARCEVNIDECVANPCKNNGTCQDGINDYKCTCNAGFTGSDCEIKIDYCRSNPCENNGKCMNFPTEYKCLCSSGYTGRNCSININECMSKPCLHGTCQDLVNGFRCSCLPGFSGFQCQENIDDCKDNPCRNNATCVDGVNSYQCICQEGFNGTLCEIEINPCDSFPCYNGGTCKDEDKQYMCSCPSGFTGRNCEVNIDDCKPTNPCQNNGSCTDLVSDYTCTCPAGFYGRHCENITNHCINSNCSQNSKCINLPLGFKCNCTEGYYGPTCAFKVKPCTSSPCLNGATCTNKDEGYNCSCRAGYTGNRCEVNIDECQSHMCLNNATCIDQVNGYMCVCWDGFNGTHCEHQLYSCNDQPCMNDGTCVNVFGGYKCECSERFGGLRCEADKNPCKTNPCWNAGTCKEYNITSFSCTCAPGFEGPTCDVNINECASSPCPLHANCIDKVNGYECKCHQSHTGQHCETVINDNFDLLFQDKSDTSSVELKDRKNVPNMESFTIALWVRPDVRYKNGTMITYMVPESQGEVVEISFTAKAIQVRVKLDIIHHGNVIIDGKWHLIGVSWSRSQNTFSLYVDGQNARTVFLPSGPPLKGGGWIILGQKYSWSKKQYVASESFVGILHQVNIWKNAANQEYMWNAAHKCSWPIGGDVNSWIGFMFGTRGNVMKKFPSSCKALELCMQNCTHYVDCNKIRDSMVCNCQKGFTGQLCDVNIDDCASNPCVNGKCVDDIATYQCECQKGFYGDRCEKKLESTAKECPALPKIENGKIAQRTYGGKHIATLTCNDNYGFKPEDVTKYSCGPETDWKWNRQEKITLPRCLGTSEPIAIRHKYEMLIPLNPSRCRTTQQYQRLRSSFKQAFMISISSLDQHKCFALGNCKIENINAPRCGNESQRQARAIVENLEIHFELAFSEWGNSSQHSTVTENAEAVAFQLSYAISVGNFTMIIDGTPVKPRGSSLKLVSNSHQCKDGYVNSYDNASCVACPAGTHLHSNFRDCVPCPIGQYQDMEGKMTCKKCPDGYSTKIGGAARKDQCYDEGTPLWKYIVPVAVLTLLLIVIAVLLISRRNKGKNNTKIDHQYSTLYRRAAHNQENKGYDESGEQQYNTLKRWLPQVPPVRFSQESQRYDETGPPVSQHFSTFLSTPGSQGNQGYDKSGDATGITNGERIYEEIDGNKQGTYDQMDQAPQRPLKKPQYENAGTEKAFNSPRYENKRLPLSTFGESKV